MEDTKIRENLKKFYEPVEMPGGYTFDHVDTLKTIDKYYMGHFKKGNKDSRGRRKPFYQISKPTIDVSRKFHDIDLKDVLAYNENPGEDQEWKVWLMIQELKRWLKVNNFGTLLNQINDDYPKYGHVIVRRAEDNRVHKVNIQNCRFDPSSQNFKTDTWFAEIIEMQRYEIKKTPWNKEKINELLSSGAASFQVYAYYQRNDEGGWDRCFVSDLFKHNQGGKVLSGTEALLNTRNDFVPAIELHEDTVSEEDFPYRELKFEDIPGRRLGYGFMEYLFENQISENEIAYLEKIALHFKALQNWTTKDGAVAGNILNDMELGDIIKTADELRPVLKDNSDLSAFNNSKQRWSSNTEKKTFSYDASRGENSPSGTPLGLAQINVGQIMSFFQGKKEPFGLFVEQLLLEDVIPHFSKSTSKEHTMSILSTAARADKFLRWFAKEEVNRQAYEFAVNGNGFMPDEATRKEEEERIYQELLRHRTNVLKMPASYYRDAKHYLRINVVGENDDPANSDTLMSIVTALAANPTLMQNPVTRAIILRVAELKGFNPIDLDMIREEALTQPQMEGQMQQGGPQQAPRMPMGGQEMPMGPRSGSAMPSL